jgi:hypothetical protein
MPSSPIPPGVETARRHELKTWPSYYAAVLDGSKTFEVRFNDRDFAVGDELDLHEWQPRGAGQGSYTSRRLLRRVTYVMHGGQFGLAQGWCILGLGDTR